VAQAVATAHLQERIFALDWAPHFAASARPSAAGELAVENELGRRNARLHPVERVSIIGIESLNLDVLVGYRLRGGTRFSSSHRNKRSHRSQQNDRRKKLRCNMSHLRLLFHLISRLYERTSIRPVGQGFKRAANPALDPWRAGSSAVRPGQPDCRHFDENVDSLTDLAGDSCLPSSV
jgi:hypothetical protein